MATTAVFAEILVIGLQVVVWLALAIISAFGTDWIDLADVSDFASLLTVLVLAFAYVLGILVDRLADTLLDWFEKKTESGRRSKKRMSKNPDLTTSEEVATMRMTVMHESEGMARFLDYQRSRWRIARATVVNLAITGPLAALYIAVRTDEGLVWTLVPLVSVLALIPITYFVGVRIQDAWVGRLKDAYAIVRTGSA